MSVAKGRRMYANRGNRRPSTGDLARDRDYSELAKRGAMGRGRLRLLASNGDREAEAELKRLGESVLDPNAGQEW
jgi:hypothetical protein